MLRIVDAAEPPLWVFLGPAPLGIAKADYVEPVKTWEAWDDLSQAAQG